MFKENGRLADMHEPALSHVRRYDAITGEKLGWSAKVDGQQVISEDQLHKRWPYDAKTGDKLRWGTKIDGKKVISYQTLKDRWPHDGQTGERLQWGATGEHIVSYHQLYRLRPTDKATGAALPYGTPLGGNIVTRYCFSQEYTFVGSDKKTYKGEEAKAKALSENPTLTFQSKKELHSAPDTVAQSIYKAPYDAITGQKLARDTKIDGKKVITYYQRTYRWPHDMRTGEKLEWGATGPHVVPYHQLNKFRPIDKVTGKPLLYGTPLGGNVVTRYVFSREYTFVGSDKKTYKGESAKAKALSENPNLTFKSKKEIYAENDRAKAIAKKKSASDAAENPAACEPQIPSASALSSATDDWIDDVEDYSALSPTLDAALNEAVASIASQAQSQAEDALVLVANSPTLDMALNEIVATTSAQPQTQTEDALVLVANSPTLGFELNALLEGIDTSAPLAQPPEFMPAYSATAASATTSDSTTAKQSKRNDNDTAAIKFAPSSSNR